MTEPTAASGRFLDWLGSERVGRFIPWLLGSVAVLFIAALVFFGLRDHYAIKRCHDRGGKTWDSGQHCVLPSGRVANTHDRIGF